MSTEPLESMRTVRDIEVIEAAGPWPSKSGGELNVLMALPGDTVRKFLDWDNQEFDDIQKNTGVDTRGLRIYTVSNIPAGAVGANEWHKARTEIVIAISGSVVWRCVDLAGNEREVVLEGRTAVMTPPGILHTYTAQEEDTRLQILCNTLFNSDDPKTHDTYSRQVFEQLQAELAQ